MEYSEDSSIKISLVVMTTGLIIGYLAGIID